MHHRYASMTAVVTMHFVLTVIMHVCVDGIIMGDLGRELAGD